MITCYISLHINLGMFAVYVKACLFLFSNYTNVRIRKTKQKLLQSPMLSTELKWKCNKMFNCRN